MDQEQQASCPCCRAPIPLNDTLSGRLYGLTGVNTPDGDDGFFPGYVLTLLRSEHIAVALNLGPDDRQRLIEICLQAFTAQHFYLLLDQMNV
jgi:hypothetical protein